MSTAARRAGGFCVLQNRNEATEADVITRRHIGVRLQEQPPSVPRGAETDRRAPRQLTRSVAAHCSRSGRPMAGTGSAARATRVPGEADCREAGHIRSPGLGDQRFAANSAKRVGASRRWRIYVESGLTISIQAGLRDSASRRCS